MFLWGKHYYSPVKVGKRRYMASRMCACTYVDKYMYVYILHTHIRAHICVGAWAQNEPFMWSGEAAFKCEVHIAYNI